MKGRHIVIGLFILLVPAGVSAHATPIEMQPRSGAQLQNEPSEIAIRFSERLEPGSSLIRVTDESGTRADSGRAIVKEDGRMLAVPMSGREGVYTVTWSVVSKDDGHFTRGSFAFSVGERAAPASSNEEVVQIASTPEASLMFVEFIGNSILWGLLALFLLAQIDSRLRRIFSILAVCAATIVLVGVAGQLILKSYELSLLHEIGLFEALRLYVHTVAGYSTIIRGAALSIGGVAAAVFAFRSLRTTVVLLGIPLVVFAYFRAIVSHATANLFYPGFSVAINFVHVIEKDLWFGALLVLCILSASRLRKSVVPELVPRVVALLSANLAILSASAGYIVWLHLKDFSNLTGSAWGQAFVPLLCTAIVLVLLHTYHVITLYRYPRIFERYFPTTLGAATVAAMLVVFFSSVVIITSPPLDTAPIAYSKTDQGTTINLMRAPYEDGMALVDIRGAHETPTVIIGSGEGGLMPALTTRYEGGYVFPSALAESTRVNIIVPRFGAYDARVSFETGAEDFAPLAGHGRTLDIFTYGMIAISSAGVLVAFLLWRVARSIDPVRLTDTALAPRVLIGAVVSLTLVLAGTTAVSHVFKNEFKADCVADGNAWHLMQPTYAGVAVSDTPREGCMWGMGDYMYLFADKREYDYLRSFGTATVAFSSNPETPHAGVPTRLTFKLTDSDGTPATLLIDMERYVHIVIVSKDESVFAHVHPDDTRPLTQEDITAATFFVPYTFPKAGEYLISIDYAHGTQLESKQFKVIVSGSPAQDERPTTFPSPGRFGDYAVAMDYRGAEAGAVTTLTFSVTRGGVPVTDMRAYLAAVSHISVVKNDLSEFIHTHGEVHATGTPYLPIIVRNGKIIHSMEAMMAPASFGPSFEAHVLFPTPGRYTVWAQFSVHGEVIPASFTVDVE